MGPVTQQIWKLRSNKAKSPASQLLSAEPELRPRCSGPPSITQTHLHAEIIVKLQYMGTFFFLKASFTILKQFGLSA